MNIDINIAMTMINSLALLFIAVLAWMTRKDAADIKIHTNGMKDALVEAKEEVAASRAVEATLLAETVGFLCLLNLKKRIYEYVIQCEKPSIQS